MFGAVERTDFLIKKIDWHNLQEINKTLSLRGVYVCLSKQKEEFYMFDVAILFMCLEVDLLY